MKIPKSLGSIVGSLLVGSVLSSGCNRNSEPYIENAHYDGHTFISIPDAKVHFQPYSELAERLGDFVDENGNSALRYRGRRDLYDFQTDSPVMIEIDYERDLLRGNFRRETPVVKRIRQE